MSADEKGFEFHAQPQTGAYSCSVLDSLFCNLSVLKPRGHYFFHLKAFANIFLIIIRLTGCIAAIYYTFKQHHNHLKLIRCFLPTG